MSLGEEQISFSCSVICISAESAAAHVRSPGPMASLPLVTPTSVWGRALWRSLTCNSAFNMVPSLYLWSKMQVLLFFQMLGEASPNVPSTAQSRTPLSITHHVKYCMLNLVWLFFFFFPYSGFTKELCNQLLQ